MGLALLDVADAIRPHPEVVAFLRRVERRRLPRRAAQRSRAAEKRAEAIDAYLERYGMRCAGEIDITRPRWSERPTTLLPVLLANIKSFGPGAAERRFEQGRQEAWDKEQELLARLRTLPDGERKAREVKQMIDRVRTFIGYREYPKYGIVSRYFVYKQALMAEADRLVRAGVLRRQEDIFYLTLQELARRRAHPSGRSTSSSASARTRSGPIERSRRRACSPRKARPSPGPTGATTCRPARWPACRSPPGPSRGGLASSWTSPRPISKPATSSSPPTPTPAGRPLFVAIAGLVTEVGGLMTHGAVIAREYGLPAVVGVEHATRLIHDGQRIRVHGTDGYVEILP